MIWSYPLTTWSRTHPHSRGSGSLEYSPILEHCTAFLTVPHLSQYHIFDAHLLTATEELTLQHSSFSIIASLTILSWDTNLCLMLPEWWLWVPTPYTHHNLPSSDSWGFSHRMATFLKAVKKKLVFFYPQIIETQAISVQFKVYFVGFCWLLRWGVVFKHDLE